MEVERVREVLREAGQVVVVRREQRPRAHLAVDELRRRAGDGEAVGRRGAATDLVEEDERVRGGVVEDVGQFRHLAHKGRLPARDVVGGPDAGEYPVQDGQFSRRRGDERPGLREQTGQRDLPHIRRLPAHIRAGDDGDVTGVEVDPVGDELRLRPLDDRVATLFDPQRLRAHFGPDVVFARGHGGEGGEDVQSSERLRERLEPVGRVGDPGAHLAEDLVLQGVGALGGREDLVFAALQFRRVEPLGVLQRLPPGVVVGDAVQVRVRHLDVVAVDLVVPDFEGVDAGPLALALLQRGDPLSSLAFGRADLVEFLVEALADDAALGDLLRRIGNDRPVDQVTDLAQFVE